MAEQNIPSPDPGRNKASRERWGKQIIDICTSLKDSNVRLEALATANRDELVKINDSIKAIEGDKEELGQFRGETTTEIRFLKHWSKWALGIGVTFLLALGAITASVVSSQNALLADIRNTSRNQDEDRKHARAELTEFRKGLDAIKDVVSNQNALLADISKTSKNQEEDRKTARADMMALRNSIDSINTTVHDFGVSLNKFETSLQKFEVSLQDFQVTIASFNKFFDEQNKKIAEINEFVKEIKKNRGESFSEFATQRAFLTQNELKERPDKQGPLVFDIKPVPDPLSAPLTNRSARPSGVLALPHNSVLDRYGFQIKVKKLDDGILQVRLSAQSATLDALEKFLRQEKGIIPLDLTVRTPVDQ